MQLYFVYFKLEITTYPLKVDFGVHVIYLEMKEHVKMNKTRNLE